MAKILHIFDYDDTLTYTPTFAEYMDADEHGIVDVGQSQDGDAKKGQLRNMQRIFQLIFARRVVFQVQGDYILVVDAQSGRPFTGEYLGIVEDKVAEILEQGNPDDFTQRYGVKRSSLKDFPDSLADQQGHLVIREIRGFHKDENTIGSKVNEELKQIYESAQYKMIVTGRDESLKKAIDMTLRWVELDFPNLGLHCYPKGAKDSIPIWKSQVILEAIKEGEFDTVHFYEDKANWLKATEQRVNEELPNVNFIGHHVTNIKHSRSI